jgi:DNA-binding GntR family transcriptional regulator
MTRGSSPRLYQRVFEILAEQIRRGALGAGAILTETGVAARFGISRAPARQALDELVRAGLIARAARRGFQVAGGGPGALASPAGPDAAPPEITRLVPRPSWERILGEVEGEIMARTSFAAWRVNEAELARHYGVSRTVARDVIGRLQQSGVVQKDTRSRWYAPALTPQHVGELYELRWILEPVALRKSAANLPATLLPELRLNVLLAIEGEGPVAGATLDALENDLHVRLLGHCGNRSLVQAISAPQSLLIVHRFLYRWTAALFGTEPFLKEHLEVYDRLAAGQVETAADVLENHLRVSLDRALVRIDVIARGTQPEPLSYLEILPPER